MLCITKEIVPSASVLVLPGEGRPPASQALMLEEILDDDRRFHSLVRLRRKVDSLSRLQEESARAGIQVCKSRNHAKYLKAQEKAEYMALLEAMESAREWEPVDILRMPMTAEFDRCTPSAIAGRIGAHGACGASYGNMERFSLSRTSIGIEKLRESEIVARWRRVVEQEVEVRRYLHQLKQEHHADYAQKEEELSSKEAIALSPLTFASSIDDGSGSWQPGWRCTCPGITATADLECLFKSAAAQLLPEDTWVCSTFIPGLRFPLNEASRLKKLGLEVLVQAKEKLRDKCRRVVCDWLMRVVEESLADATSTAKVIHSCACDLPILPDAAAPREGLAEAKYRGLVCHVQCLHCLRRFAATGFDGPPRPDCEQ